ncbi:MAG: GIY-YIG nuclease family protein [Deltaproteobacteria bacterium]|nr:GIY-YIG nuclease family protein [Deltaproteobacteria bacterium]
MYRWSLYVLRCGDGSLYTGVAVDVARRFAQHAAGKGARYTRGRGPLTLIAKTSCADRSAALRAELRFKRLSRSEKQAVLARRRGLLAFARRAVGR